MTTALFPAFEQQTPGLCATGQSHEDGPHARSPLKLSAAFAVVPVMPAAL